jgi:hypothetical protein
MSASARGADHFGPGGTKVPLLQHSIVCGRSSPESCQSPRTIDDRQLMAQLRAWTADRETGDCGPSAEVADWVLECLQAVGFLIRLLTAARREWWGGVAAKSTVTRSSRLHGKPSNCFID